jgi:poly(3-hydroxybutyrate) depolymerase
LKIGCKAPDVFAGIGAIAGPSVGSNQGNATAEGNQIPNTNVDNAVETCQSLAGDNYPSFATQVANIAYGTMDRNGPQQIYSCWDQNHAGQDCVASIKWSEDNIEILRKIYGTGELGNATSIQEGRGKEQSATTDGRTRLSLIVIPDVGHAFPAGTGKPNNSDNGQYIAQQGLNYPQYIAKWLTEHNIRAVPQGGPVITVNTPTVSGKDLTFTGKVSGQGPIREVDTILRQGDGAGNFKETETHKNVATAAGDFTDTYRNLVTGVYEVTVTAMDDKNHSRSATTKEVAIGNPWKCTQSYTSNYEHVQAGRAYDQLGTAHAKGSNDKMGLDNTYYKTTLAQTKKDYFVVGSCPSKGALWSTAN